MYTVQLVDSYYKTFNHVQDVLIRGQGYYSYLLYTVQYNLSNLALGCESGPVFAMFSMRNSASSIQFNKLSQGRVLNPHFVGWVVFPLG